MLIRLNKKIQGMVKYNPPIPVEVNTEISDSMSDDERITALLWIPSMLVCRFLYQFPFLKTEADELFSIGLFVVVDTVKNSPIEADKIGAHININCCSAIEEYCNNLNSVVSVKTRTRYRNKKDGKETPRSIRLTHEAKSVDDNTELLIKDVCEHLGVDVKTMSNAVKRQIVEILLGDE